MKSLNIPMLQCQKLQDLDTALELGGERFQIDCLNWPEDFPYAPICAGRIGRTYEALVVDFRVSGLDLRIQNLADGGRIWEDSACEIFIQPFPGAAYFNFEVNAAGYLLAACGSSRNARTALCADALARVIRIPSLEGQFLKETVNLSGLWNWRVTLVIPWTILGLDCAALPSSLRGNLYKCGDLTAHPHFATWAPVQTPAPDYHRPEYFGEFKLV
jgi:hypothetical protein